MADQLLDFDSDTEMGSITERGTAATGITAITAANPAVVTVANDFENGDTVAFSACGGMTEINDRWVTVSGASATGFTTDLNTSSGFTAYSGSAGRVDIIHAVNNDVRITYDDAQTKAEIVTALQRGVEKVIELGSGVRGNAQS